MKDCITESGGICDAPQPFFLNYIHVMSNMFIQKHNFNITRDLEMLWNCFFKVFQGIKLSADAILCILTQVFIWCSISNKQFVMYCLINIMHYDFVSNIVVLCWQCCHQVASTEPHLYKMLTSLKHSWPLNPSPYFVACKNHMIYVWHSKCLIQVNRVQRI